MRCRALVLIFLLVKLFFVSSCFSADPHEEAKKKYRYLREVSKEDKRRMKRLKSKQSIYRLRGKRSRVAQNDFGNELIEYLTFLIEESPKVREHLGWFEKNKKRVKVKISPYLSGGRSISKRKQNESKGIFDPRMYVKRRKNIEGRLDKKTPISPNEIKNIKYPLSK